MKNRNSPRPNRGYKGYRPVLTSHKEALTVEAVAPKNTDRDEETETDIAFIAPRPPRLLPISSALVSVDRAQSLLPGSVACAKTSLSWAKRI